MEVNVSPRTKRTTLLAAAIIVGGTCVLPTAPAKADGCNAFFAFPDPGVPSKYNVELVEHLDRDHEFRMYLRTTDNQVQTAGWNQGRTGMVPSQNEVPSVYVGDANGGLAGRTIDVKMFWKNGTITAIKGQVNDDRSASGTIARTGNFGPPDGKWRSVFADFRCAKGHKMGQRPVGEGEQTIAVAADVDVYNVKNEPDGTGHVIGALQAGNRVKLVGTCEPDSWCEVMGDSVPAGHGWVWGHLQLR
jgi:hypothetical protein